MLLRWVFRPGEVRVPVPTPSLVPDRSSLEQRQLLWAHRLLRTLAKESTYVHAAVGLGGAAGGIALEYLPLSPLYIGITAPFLLLGLMFTGGAIAKSVERAVRRRRQRRRKRR